MLICTADKLKININLQCRQAKPDCTRPWWPQSLLCQYHNALIMIPIITLRHHNVIIMTPIIVSGLCQAPVSIEVLLPTHSYQCCSLPLCSCECWGSHTTRLAFYKATTVTPGIVRQAVGTICYIKRNACHNSHLVHCPRLPHMLHTTRKLRN